MIDFRREPCEKNRHGLNRTETLPAQHSWRGMQRFFFHVITSACVIRDEEGSELADLPTARAEAIEDIRMLISDPALLGRDVSSRSMAICDEAGNTLLALPFKDALTPCD
ncbi:hypothetical protein SAMN03159406_04933 [Rhizobium sp. NFR03]|nr:hypothetical protein SAMN03159406_04933 [Rhizobium sp. NFR03]